MTVEDLYPLVSEAILRAETLEDLQAPGARAAYQDVSLLEEKVADALPVADPEGALARRGAVRAALTARDFARARQLAERFLAEAGNDAELIRLSQQVESLVVSRFPRVAAGVGIQEVRRVARELSQQGAPFPIP